MLPSPLSSLAVFVFSKPLSRRQMHQILRSRFFTVVLHVLPDPDKKYYKLFEKISLKIVTENAEIIFNQIVIVKQMSRS